MIYAKGTDRPTQSMSNILMVFFKGSCGIRRVQRDISPSQGDQCMLPGLTKPYGDMAEILIKGRGPCQVNFSLRTTLVNYFRATWMKTSASAAD